MGQVGQEGVSMIEFTWWRPLTEKDIEEFELELKGMDEYLVGVR